MAFLLAKLSFSPIAHSNAAPNTSPKQPLLFSSPLTKLETPLLRRPPALHVAPPVVQHRPPPPPNQSKRKKDDFYLNLGLAVRTLRDDLPALFARDLNYDIYREDITFIDPLNTFQGIDNYRTIFWALRFHGRVLFREIKLEIFRVWQPSENMILIRWELRGVPRVPWEARGQFQGTSRYKLDRSGKIYEHKVDNLALNFPQAPVGPATVMDLVAATCRPTPNLTFWIDQVEVVPGLSSCSWVELYRAVRGALEEGQGSLGIGIEGLVACS